MAEFTRVKIPLRVTYYLEKDNTVILENDVTPTLDLDMETIRAAAQEAGITVERYIVQWFTRNYAYRLGRSKKQKAELAKIAKQHNRSFKVEVSLVGDITYPPT